MHMGCSGVHPCACEQQVGKKRKKTGRKKIRKEYEVRKEGKWARKKESRRPIAACWGTGVSQIPYNEMSRLKLT